MIPDPDIWRAANLVLKHHGDDAPKVAAQRAEALRDQGDTDGQQVWTQILRAVEELARLARKPDEGLN